VDSRFFKLYRVCIRSLPYIDNGGSINAAAAAAAAAASYY